MNVGAALLAAERRLVACSATARLDARLLLADAMGIEANAIIGAAGGALPPDSWTRFEAALTRRLAGEPVSRILGRRAFWTLDLAISPDVLDPRPDSEAVIEAVLARLPDRSKALTLLDLGTGSGCLLLALLSELNNANGLGVDVSEAALRVARANAASNGLAGRARFLAADWASGLRGSFDVVVSNPPYIADGEIDALAPEVRAHDPRLALAGGPDGLSAYRKFVPCLRNLVNLDGFVVLEVGRGQAAAVVHTARDAGFIHIGSQYDLARIERAVVLQPRHAPPC